MFHKPSSRLALVVLSMTSVVLALSNVRESAPAYWYLFFSPLMLGAYFYGVKGAAAAAGATVISLALLFQNAVLFRAARAVDGVISIPLFGNLAPSGGAAPEASNFTALIGALLLVAGAILVGYLIDQRREQEERLRKILSRDPLTGLSTRQHFIQTLRIWQNRKPTADGTIGLLIFDIDHFGALQRQFGHFSGDLILERASRYLAALKNQGYEVARLGSDEFGLAHCSTTPTELRTVAEAILGELGEYDWMGKREEEMNHARVSASFGIALKPQDGKTAGELFESAWEAQESQKAAGGNGYRFASCYPEIEKEAPEPLITLDDWRGMVTKIGVA